MLYYVLGQDTSAPYELTWNNPAAGSYVLLASARDNQGRIGLSAGVGLEVKPAFTNPPPFAVRDDLAAPSTKNGS